MSDHSKALWRESSGSGVVLAAAPMYLRYDGADVVFSAIAPAELAFFALGADGDYTLLDLVPRFFVFDGADLVIDAIGPAAAIIADDGAGGLEITTDLTRTPVADLLSDGAGNIYVVPRTADRLEAVTVGGNIQLY